MISICDQCPHRSRTNTICISGFGFCCNYQVRTFGDGHTNVWMIRLPLLTFQVFTKQVGDIILAFRQQTYFNIYFNGKKKKIRSFFFLAMRDMCSDIRVGNYIYRRLLPSSTSNLHFLIFF